MPIRRLCGRFATPWNKGLNYCPKGSEATQFKKGCLRGKAARLYCAVGTIQVRHEKPPKRMRGRLNGRKGKPCRWIKVRDDGPPKDRWIPYARYLYKKQHGPIPKGLFVVHDDGNTMNDSLGNLILVDRRENMRRLYRRPEVIALCRKLAGKRTKERHAAARKLKVAKKVLVSYECMGCGESYAKCPEQCGKCGGVTFERNERQEMPDSEKEAVLVRVTESELLAG